MEKKVAFLKKFSKKKYLPYIEIKKKTILIYILEINIFEKYV